MDKKKVLVIVAIVIGVALIGLVVAWLLKDKSESKESKNTDDNIVVDISKLSMKIGDNEENIKVYSVDDYDVLFQIIKNRSLLKSM